MTAAISSGSAKRPSGTFACAAASACSRVTPRAAAAWSASPPSASHSGEVAGPGRDGVDEHAVADVAIGVVARQRQLRGLRHRVGDVRQRRALARRRADVDDPPAARGGHPRRGRAHEPHRAHDVELPLALPVVVGELLERAHEARAGVVDEHVDGPEAARRTRPRCARPSPACGDVRRRPTRAPSSAATRAELVAGARDEQHPRALRAQQPRRREADAARRAGDDARLAVEPEVHAINLRASARDRAGSALPPERSGLESKRLTWRTT